MSIIFPQPKRGFLPLNEPQRMTLPTHFYLIQHESLPFRSGIPIGRKDLLFETEQNFQWDDLAKGPVEKAAYPSDPGSRLIPVFNSLEAAESWVKYSYTGGKLISPQRRITVFELSSAGLQPLLWSPKANDSVKIPIWSDLKIEAMPGVKLAPQFLPNILEDTWICMSEVRDIIGIGKQIKAKSHWLACGSVVKKRLVRVMPFDGKNIVQAHGAFVRSEDFRWLFNWEQGSWVQHTDLPYSPVPRSGPIVPIPAPNRQDSENQAGQGPLKGPERGDLDGQETKEILKDILLELRKLNLSIAELKGPSPEQFEPPAYPEEH